LELTGASNINGTGNTLGNTLDGSTSTGANVLAGGDGDDEYILGAGDAVVENADQGYDSVTLTAASPTSTYDFSASSVELVELTIAAGAMTVIGNSEANVLIGNDSDNTLIGGAGDDELYGGDDGNDTYAGFGVGSGADVIGEGDGLLDVVAFATDQNTQIEQLQFSTDDLAVIVAINSLDSVRFHSAAIEELHLWENGLLYKYTNAQMNARASGTNSAPIANGSVVAPEAMATEAYSFQVPANLFSDAESQHSLAYSATLSNGSPLPSWLHFDSTTRTFWGTPASADATALSLRLTATDAGSLSANTIFTLNVRPFVQNGTAGDDNLSGDAANNVIYGLGGNDTIHGLGGDDELAGDAGNDTLFGEAGSDALYGGDDNDLIYGGSEDDYLEAGAGNDTLDGGSGADEMWGELGDDVYVVDAAGDSVNEAASEGTDTVQSGITYTLGSNVENLTLTGTAANGTGNGLDNVIVGNGANNQLSGGSGNDTLDGGFGNDQLTGGQGNDAFYVDSTSDTALESSNQGTDTVYSSVNWTLTTNFEHLTLIGNGNVSGTGNGSANTITGNSGNNAIDGLGGNDTMIGGAGNDTYTVDSTSDVVTELANGGTDLVNSSATFTLGNDVENLTLTLSGTVNGTGNGLDNVLTGNSANNTLTGLGGNDTIDGMGGNDTMIGGAGNDTYTVAQTLDAITELANEGTDLVNSSINYTLGNFVENLTLSGTSGLSGTGNALDNVITGNSGANTLSGGDGNDTLNGMGGSDPMTGGLGNDIFYVDVSGDSTAESANQGFDTIMSSMTRTLVSNIEALFLTGSSAINATGLTTANLLRGNSGTNTLNGAGGTDILEGLAGTDTLQNSVSANTFMNGGADNDTLTSTANNDMLIGGLGNDAITTGQGADIIVFNQGEGQDTVASSTTKDNVLALGGGILYADLLFQKSGNNLILKTGGTDQITFTNYYASASNRSVDMLQIVIEGTTDYVPGGDAQHNKKITTFNFDGLVTAFDAARTANPSLTTWALTNALVAQHLGGSDTAAIGGDLSYRYGRFDSLSDISFTPAAALLAAAGFGTSAQNLQSLASLQDTTPRLN
jgi:Ca2+-binding RTX toxin-like protein